MKAALYWIEISGPGRLAIAPRPRGGEWLPEEIKSWVRANVKLVISMLTHDEIRDLDLKIEQRECQNNGIEYISFPVPDRGVPSSRAATLKLARAVNKQLSNGKAVLVHCRAGIGRSALLAACILALSGLEPETVFRRIESVRGCEVPDTAAQRKWVDEWVQAMPVQTT